MSPATTQAAAPSHFAILLLDFLAQVRIVLLCNVANLVYVWGHDVVKNSPVHIIARKLTTSIYFFLGRCLYPHWVSYSNMAV